ncbi:MAG: hypothetical protein U5L45_21530 [Saprospiraceae bacterium]|nr:hypothetical protein [Saprospiraceae bacterium]
MVHFSGKARKMNHILPFCASEASNRLKLSQEFFIYFTFPKCKSNYDT